MKKCIVLQVFLLCSLLSVAQGIERSTIKTQGQENVASNGRTFGIVIGVSTYQKLPSLNYAADDAKLMRYLLLSAAAGNVPAENIKIYTDSAANTGNITVSCFEWLNTKAIKKGDKIFFYLAGHGEADEDEQFFLTHDAEPTTGIRNYDIAGNLEMSRLKRWLKTYVVKGADVFLIIDACRSKATAKNNDSLGAQVAKYFYQSRQETALPGFTTFYATQDGAFAYESASIGNGHGLFTFYFVLGALGEADKEGVPDGKTTVSEIGTYLKRKVAQVSKQKFNNLQLPKYCCDLNDEKDIFVSSGPQHVSNPTSEIASASLRKLMEQEPEISVVARNAGTNNSDLAILGVYKRFESAIHKANYIYESGSALAIWKTMMKNWPDHQLTEQARLKLISSLINYSRTAIIKYLLGLDQEFINKKIKLEDEKSLYYRELSRVATATDFIQPAHCTQVAMDLMKDNTEMQEYLYPKLLFLKARSYFDGNPEVTIDSAIKFTQIALQYDTAADHLFHLLAMLEAERGNFEIAKKYLNQAITGKSLYNKAGAEIGYEFFNLNMIHEASLFYRLGILTSSDYAIAYNHLAIKNDEIGSEAKALKFFMMALPYDKSNDTRNNLSVYYHKKGSDFEKRQQLDSAIFYITTSLTFSPKATEVMIHLGNLYNKLGFVLKARDLYQRVVTLDPRNVSGLTNLSVVYFNHQVYDSAKYFSKKVLQVSKPSSNDYKQAVRIIQKSVEAEKNGVPKQPILNEQLPVLKKEDHH